MAEINPVPVLFGDVVKSDIAELTELVLYFRNLGKHENANFLSGVRDRYEIICSAYSSAIRREADKKATPHSAAAT
jgi:hypothetical protein